MRIAAALCGVALGHTRVAVAQATTVSRGWAAAATALVKLHAPTGTLIVEGWDRDSVAYSGAVASGETSFGGGTRAAIKAGLEGVATGGASRIVARVPRRATLVVRAGAASVEIRGMLGSVDAGSAAGSVTISGTMTDVTAESLSGSVTIAGRMTTLRARTTGGRLAVTGGAGEAQLTTVSGTVVVDGTPLGSVRVSSVNGPVTLSGALAPDALVDVNTFGGDVRITLPRGSRAALDLHSSRGTIAGRLRDGATDVELAIVARNSSGGTALQRAVGGAGSAAPNISVRTSRGAIEVSSAPR